jgi:hypothetical protein
MAGSDEVASSPPVQSPTKIVERDLFNASRFPFIISVFSIGAIILIFLYQQTGDQFFGPVNKDDSQVMRFLMFQGAYIPPFFIGIFSVYIGYRLLSASGATKSVVIPPEDYALLAPLVSEGKTESIDQYVRLSSLAKFTGTFTQLGLTGLPLATIFLTIFFSVLTIFLPDSFLDLSKLTLGAFIGSFVQRQVERRSEGGNKESADSLKEIAPVS